MASILYDCILSAKIRGSGQRISYSRSKAWWANTKRYRGSEYTYTRVKNAVEALVAAGYLIGHWIAPSYNPAHRKPSDDPRQSSFRPADFLADMPMVVSEKKDGVGVVLKDFAGSLVNYRDTERTERDRRTMETINRRLRTIQISLDAPHRREGSILRFSDYHAVNTDDIDLYRVFSGDWTMGGRMYGGWWQNVSKHVRAFIRIDGEKTIEEDYAQMHPRMLYATLGISHPDDAYRIPGYESRRPACKTAWNTLLNADSYRKALYSLANSEHFHGDVNGARSLLAAIQNMHRPIARYFCSGIGLRLQYFDSRIAKDVLLTLGKKGIACLPVHDSFIVQERYRETLVCVMEEALRKVTGKPDFVGDIATKTKIKVRNDLHTGAGVCLGVAGAELPADSESASFSVLAPRGASGSGRGHGMERDTARPATLRFKATAVGEGRERADRKVLEVVDDIEDSFFPDVEVVARRSSKAVVPVAAPSSGHAVLTSSGSTATTTKQTERAKNPGDDTLQVRHSNDTEFAANEPSFRTSCHSCVREATRNDEFASMNTLHEIQAKKRRQHKQEAPESPKKPGIMPPQWMSRTVHDRTYQKRQHGTAVSSAGAS